MKFKSLIFVTLICIFANSCTNTNNNLQTAETVYDISQILTSEEATSKTDETETTLSETESGKPYIPEPTILSYDFYPEYIYLSENFYTPGKIYSPIDHDYNLSRLNDNFIGDSAWKFMDVWMDELNYQYNKCLENISEEYKEQFIKVQEAWKEYYDNDVFPGIAMHTDEEGITIGYGFVRESALIHMDKIRTRTIEIMRNGVYIQGITEIEFKYQSTEN